MSALLDYSKGRAAIFSVGETPWHGEGEILAQAPNLTEALRLGGLDFDVEKLPTFRPVGNGDYVQNALAFVTVRTDTGAELGAVGPDYRVLQNRDAFRAFEPLLDTGIMTLETGGALRSGRDVWMLGRFDVTRFGPVVREVFADEVVPFALIRNNHAGMRVAGCQLTPIRVVCANTLGMADRRADAGQDKAITVRHTGDVEARMVQAARDLFAGIVERYETVATQYKRLKAFYLDEAMFRELVLDVAAPLPIATDSPRFESTLARAEDKRSRLTTLWTSGKGHTGDHSAWEAYNGVVEAVDHDDELFAVRGDSRVSSLVGGKLGQVKQNVLNSLVGAAK